MEIRYDKEADSMYIEFRKGKFARNKKIDDFTIIDYDKEGNMLGMEFIAVSKTMPKKSLSEINVKNIAIAN